MKRKRKLKNKKPSGSIKSIGEVIRENYKRGKFKVKKPLPRHKVLLKKMSGNIGKGSSLGKAMREQGYSASYSDNPQRLKETKSWNVLVEQELPDHFLTEKHKILLNSKMVQRFIFPMSMLDEDIIDVVNSAGFNVIVIRKSPMGKMAFYSIENARGIKDGLDMAYKLKGKYTPEEISIKFGSYSKEQLIDMIAGKIGK